MNLFRVNVLVAEACGWIPELRRCEIPEADFLHEETFWTRNGKTRRGLWLPNYVGSLDACVEMEETIWNSHRNVIYQYLTTLAKICGRNPPDALESTVVVMRATSQQRCEAFLKTRGKWEEYDKTRDQQRDS